jgi:tetratricopeptide (TPR) repeat protein
LHSLAVGNYERADEIIEAARQIDPLNQTIHGVSVLVSGLLGDVQRAEGKYRRGKEIFGDHWYLGNVYITILRLGIKKNLSRDYILFSSPISDEAKEHFDSPKEGLSKLRRIYNNDDNLTSTDFVEISVWAAYFGDPEFALNALERAVSISSHQLALYWYLLMKEARQLPRFKEFVKEIGLVDYWKEYGWPDLCHPVGDDDFVCDEFSLSGRKLCP